MDQEQRMGGIVVLAGGLSTERDVSLQSGRRVAAALRDEGVEVRVLDVDTGLLAALRADPPDVVVPVLHGAAGEDGSLREVLDSVGVRYLGSGPAACRLAFDKPVAKSLVATAGVATPDSVTLTQASFRDLGAPAVLDALVARLGLPLMVKPARGGSALGASVVRDAGELPAAMVAVFGYGPTAVLERYVGGPGTTEVAVAVVDDGTGPRALPVVEIRPDGGYYDYTARYTAGATEFVVPAELPAHVLAACADVAVTAHQALGLADWSRTDLLVDASGTPWFLEVNVAPGMTETSTFPLAVHAAGLTLGAVLQTLIRRVGAPRLREAPAIMPA